LPQRRNVAIGHYSADDDDVMVIEFVEMLKLKYGVSYEEAEENYERLNSGFDRLYYLHFAKKYLQENYNHFHNATLFGDDFKQYLQRFGKNIDEHESLWKKPVNIFTLNRDVIDYDSSSIGRKRTIERVDNARTAFELLNEKRETLVTSYKVSSVVPLHHNFF
jgi:hypothetical protein